jgi:cytochrome c oxidase subunit 2
MIQSGWHSVLHPGGVQASIISRLWWLMFAVSVTVFLLVIVFTAIAVWRTPKPVSEDAQASSRELKRSTSAAVVVTLVTLLFLLVASTKTGRAIQSLDDSGGLSLVVTANQWWWNVEYDSPTASEHIRTANEIHLPVGRVARINLASNDVIHSFWVPGLHGKEDLIPGRLNRIEIRADKPGVYWGQCAEYCGTQHAHMAFVVIAESPEQFAAWAGNQLQEARTPAADDARRGEMLFENGSCAMCHTVMGTRAGSRIGPDLTHVASRQTIAAGTLPNNFDSLREWIFNPHHFKPGTKMPVPGVSEQDARDLAAYLRTLQ